MNTSINKLALLIASCLASYSYFCSAQELSLATKVNSVEECQQYIDKNSIVVVYFYNNRCGWCKRATPVIELAAITYSQENNIRILKIDTDEVPGVADKFTLHHVPTILFFKNGNQVESRKHLTFDEFNDLINSLKETL